MKVQNTAIRFNKNETTSEYIEETIQTSFLIPISEDKDFGEGEIHLDWKWSYLESELYEKFGGWTMANNLLRGGWVNPKSKERIEDISRKYFVDIKRKDFSKLVSLIGIFTGIFKQNCIRLECDRKVQYVEESI